MLKGVGGFTKDMGLTARAVKPPLEDVLIMVSGESWTPERRRSV